MGHGSISMQMYSLQKNWEGKMNGVLIIQAKKIQLDVVNIN